jgi:hypothetical protein
VERDTHEKSGEYVGHAGVDADTNVEIEDTPFNVPENLETQAVLADVETAAGSH